MAAIPMSAFCDPRRHVATQADVWNHLVRFTFCKRDDTLDEAIRRLAALTERTSYSDAPAALRLMTKSRRPSVAALRIFLRARLTRNSG